MRLQDLHTHSVFDDGSATLEQMVRAAFKEGLSAIGLSCHSPLVNEDWTMPKIRMQDFLQESTRLKQKYKGKIEVWCGIEYDLCSRIELSGFDYVIGSLHTTVTPAGSFYADYSADITRDGIDRFFAGDADAAAEAYFAQYRAMAENPAIEVVGHFDLITKFNEQGRLYDAESPRYQAAARAAMRELAEAGKIFEINSGAMSRGYRSEPYPARDLLEYLHSIGGNVCLTSDAHSVHGVGYAFLQSLELARDCGFKELWFLTDQGFVPVTIKEIER